MVQDSPATTAEHAPRSNWAARDDATTTSTRNSPAYTSRAAPPPAARATRTDHGEPGG
ncbi:MAG TPA: hypothetical protein VMG38_09225 [Trebonia sp.]|nr:hypothetical protein [Trebonia sp.]